MSDGGLWERLRGLEGRVREAVAIRRRTDANPQDPFRGLYLSDETIDALLNDARDPFSGFDSPPPDPATRLGALALAARLTDLDIELLLVAIAPDVDSRFEQLYGYLNDDVTRRRAGVGLALRLCGLPEAAILGRARLSAGGPLIDLGILAVEDAERPFLSRALRSPDRVVAYLLGDDTLDATLTGIAGTGRMVPVDLAHQTLRSALDSGVRLVYLTERTTGDAAPVATAALRGNALLVDAIRAQQQEIATVATAVVREAVLRRAGIVVGPLDAVEQAETLLEILTRGDLPVIAHGTQPWNPRWTEDPPLHLEVTPLPPTRRTELWRSSIQLPLDPGDPGGDPIEAVAHLSLGAQAIVRAARAADLLAGVDEGTVHTGHLRAAARSQNATGLLRLARRIEPTVGWDDLVLPGDVLDALGELAARARHRDRVLDEWRMRPGGGRGRGVCALFAGDSGTGKTMSAEVIAAELGMDLYAVNLATVVDKYVGETEKNLEQIFQEAAGVNGVLLFDEADAIFGKRSEVRDAHDRYANIESAYLLQRMEAFDGLAVLATNLRANLDDAFTRRLDMVIDFPVPDEDSRLALWDRCMGMRMPRDSDVDLGFLAKSFELSGGNIRSAVVTSAYLAAAEDRPVTMADLIAAVAREYQKLGRLCLESEFGPYLDLVL
ncbi:MAG TPA: ATP-binding protein [Candidatus Limnocylindrales bacterium]|nr:ATP-binding protein [Candidatus Limnocylindrales bacterium]